MIIFTLISGLLASVILPYKTFFWLSYIFAIPLLIDLEEIHNRKKGFWRGMLFGLIFMGMFHRWILEIHPWSTWPGAIAMWVGMTVYLSLFYGLMGYLYTWLKYGNNRVILFPAIWTLCEWLRTLGPYGNPAAAIGYSQSHNPVFLQLASYLGVFGLSFLCIYINIQLFTILTIKEENQNYRTSKFVAILAVIGLVGMLQVGKLEPNLTPHPVAIVQGNHPQEKKLNRRFWPTIKDDYIRLAKETSGANIVLFPENIIPGKLLQDTLFIEKLQNIASTNNQSIVFGATEHKDTKFYNGISIVTKEGLSSTSYQKEKLMPFGEYIPYKKFFSLIGPKKILSNFEDFSPGEKEHLLPVEGLNLGGTICLESCYPTLARQRTQKGADVLAIVVNTAWFFNSPASEQHVQMSVLRAVENRRPVIQASNTGISAIIDHKGQFLAKSNLNQETILKETILIGQSKSIYTQAYWLTIVLCIGILVYAYKHVLKIPELWEE